MASALTFAAHLRLLTDASLAYLATLPNLERLSLPHGFTDAGIHSLASLDHLKYLWVNCASNSPLTDQTLASLGQLPELETLYIGGAGFTNEGVERLSNVKSLSSLHITFWPGMDNETLKLLAKHQGLRELSWGSSENVTTSGLRVLNALEDLESLSISDIRPDGGTLDLSGLKKLQGLRLSMRHEVDKTRKPYEVMYDGLGDSDLACLSGLTDLEDLSLVGSGLSDAGLAHLAPLTNLKYLQFSGGPGLTDEGLRHLSRMRRLDSLMISDCRVTERGLRYLYPLKTLHIIRLHSAMPITDQAVVRLRTELPNLQSLTLVPWKPPMRSARQESLLRRQRARARATLVRTPTRSRRRR